MVVYMYLKSSQIVLDKGNGVNEDIGHITKNAAWVLDGSTGVTNDHIFTEYDSDAQWFTHRWNDFLIDNIDRDEELKDILKEGVRTIRDEFFSRDNSKNIEKIGFPSSTLALVRWNSSKLEYFILADNIISIERDQSIKTYKDTMIDRLDSITHSKMHDFILKNNGDIDSAREHVKDILIKNRRLKNTDEGYYVLEFDDYAIDHGVHGELKADNLHILIATDGFSALAEKYKHYELDELLPMAKKYNIDKLNDELREIERSDHRGVKYPRIKVHDDSSAIYLELKKTS